MKTIPLALLLCPFLLFACGTPQSAATKSKTTTTSSKDAEAKPKDSGTTHNGQTAGQPGTSEDSEQAVPPQPLTGIYLSCAKPGVESLTVNVDCTLKNADQKRVKATDFAKKVVYDLAPKEKDDEVLIQTAAGAPEKDYDVRYSLRAKDFTKIKKVAESSTFFAKAFDGKGVEIKDAVKPFFGIDLDFPSWDEVKDKFSGGLDAVEDGFDTVKDGLKGAIGL